MMMTLTTAMQEKTTLQIVCGMKKKAHACIQCKSEPGCFSMGVVQLKADVVCTILNVSDPFEPESEVEAQAITEGCLYIGAKMPRKVIKMVEELPVFKLQYVCCNLPFMDNKEE